MVFGIFLCGAFNLATSVSCHNKTNKHTNRRSCTAPYIGRKKEKGFHITMRVVILVK